MIPAIPVFTVIHGALVAACALAQSAPERPRRPNVVILLTDDQGYGDLSAHGNPLLRTPNLDRLHGESVRFTDFHVAPMCTPTRGQLLTGVDALRNGARDVTAGRSVLRPGFPTLAELFRAGGYGTALFGKWHLGDSWPNLPQYRGFDEAVHLMGWGPMSVTEPWLNDDFDDRYHHNGKIESYRGYCTDVWFDLAMEWMAERRERGEPFLLYLPTNAPHHPAWVPAKYRAPYAGSGNAGFFGMIANLDENVGRLDRFLHESGLFDDTLLLFLNDNGGTAGVDTFDAGLRDRKGSYYEGGHRAMCFLRWPNGSLRPPGEVDALTEVQDLLPTLLELAGVAAPAAAKFDGISLAPLLRGEARDASLPERPAPDRSWPDRTLVVQCGPTPTKHDAAVLWRKWRLVHGRELYDVATDPGQQRDVAAEHEDVVQRMRGDYERWWAGVEPRLDEVVPIVLGAPQENPVTLTSEGWIDARCDNVVKCVRPGEARNSPWIVAIAEPGRYEFALRRWPAEADAAIAAGVPAATLTDGAYPEGKALPIRRARLKIGGFDRTIDVAAADHAAVFTLELAASERLPMQTWFLAADGAELCGAYYCDVRRL